MYGRRRSCGGIGAGAGAGIVGERREKPASCGGDLWFPFPAVDAVAMSVEYPARVYGHGFANGIIIYGKTVVVCYMGGFLLRGFFLAFGVDC